MDWLKIETSSKDSIELRLSVTESIFELVRRLNFSHKPSRFTSLFLVEENDLEFWKKELNYGAYPDAKILMFEVEKYSVHDASWRDMTVTNNVTKNIEFHFGDYFNIALNYWEGVLLPNPRKEILVDLYSPIKLLEILKN